VFPRFVFLFSVTNVCQKTKVALSVTGAMADSVQETAKLRVSHWHRECSIAVKAKQVLYLS
jgi:hypothetical protein